MPSGWVVHSVPLSTRSKIVRAVSAAEGATGSCSWLVAAATEERQNQPTIRMPVILLQKLREDCLPLETERPHLTRSVAEQESLHIISEPQLSETFLP